MWFHGDERPIQQRRALYAICSRILRYNLIIVEGKVIHREGGECHPLFFVHKKTPGLRREYDIGRGLCDINGFPSLFPD